MMEPKKYDVAEWFLKRMQFKELADKIYNEGLEGFTFQEQMIILKCLHHRIDEEDRKIKTFVKLILEEEKQGKEAF